jgi:hypothetical protein
MFHTYTCSRYLQNREKTALRMGKLRLGWIDYCTVRVVSSLPYCLIPAGFPNACRILEEKKFGFAFFRTRSLTLVSWMKMATPIVGVSSTGSSIDTGSGFAQTFRKPQEIASFFTNTSNEAIHPKTILLDTAGYTFQNHEGLSQSILLSFFCPVYICRIF